MRMAWPFSRILIAAAVITGGVSPCVFLACCIGLRSGLCADAGWTWRTERSRYIVEKSYGKGVSSVVQPGDRIVAINRDCKVDPFGPALCLARILPARLYTLSVIRGGAPVTLYVRMGVIDSVTVQRFLPDLLVAILLLLCGTAVLIAGSRDITTRFIVAGFFVLIFPTLSPALIAYPGWGEVSTATALLLAVLWRPWHVVITWEALSRFPEPVTEQWTGRAFRTTLYTTGMLLWATLNIPLLAQITGLPHAFGLETPRWLSFGSGPGPSTLVAAFEAATAIAFAIVLTRNYRRLPTPSARRKIRWAAAGFGLTTATYLCFKVLQGVFIITGVSEAGIASEVIGSGVTISIAVAVLSFAYVVIRHRVLGIQVVIRRGLQYLLARQVLRLVIVFPLVIVLFEIVRNPNRSAADLVLHSSWIFYAGVTATASISLRYRRVMADWVDRRFFRASLEREQALAKLIERMRGATSAAEIAVTVAREIELALPVDGIHVLLRDSPDAPLRVAFSYAPEAALRICELVNGGDTSPLRTGKVVKLEKANPSDSYFESAGNSSGEILVLPFLGITGADFGALVLGPKKSEEPFTDRDRELLQSVASQVAVVYDVLRLRERITQESKERLQVLAHLSEQGISLLRECPNCGECYGNDRENCSADGSTLTLTLPIGRVVEEKYRLDRRIGRGGMGVVYASSDLHLKRRVAVKIMIGELFGNQSALMRFTREARTVARLSHPNIIAVYDFGGLAAGGAYIVMELVSGKSLREHVRQPSPLAPERIARWLQHLCAATAFAHAQGVIHRDLKPENVMVAPTPDGERAIVLDFGLAKIKDDLEQAEGDVTFAGAVMGTRGYMSPEQRAGELVDGRTDVYAIGVLAVEMLAGLRPPRAGVSKKWVTEAIATFTHPNGNLARILTRALDDDLSRRMQSIHELGQTLPAAIREEAVVRTLPAGDNSAETATFIG
jgi:tRNA A-37 threonylcarbamoyl transferase component Bud32